MQGEDTKVLTRTEPRKGHRGSHRLAGNETLRREGHVLDRGQSAGFSSGSRALWDPQCRGRQPRTGKAGSLVPEFRLRDRRGPPGLPGGSYMCSVASSPQRGHGHPLLSHKWRERDPQPAAGSPASGRPCSTVPDDVVPSGLRTERGFPVPWGVLTDRTKTPASQGG